MVKEKMKYDPPKLMRIDDELSAEGAGCYSGSNATSGCWSGGNASVECDIGSGGPPP